MKLFQKHWVESQKDSNSFLFEFSIPVSNLDWKDKVLTFDFEFLIKAEKYGLFYFMDNIFFDYKEKRRKGFSKIIDNYIELISLRNYFSHDILSKNKFIAESYINLPFEFNDSMICKPVRFTNREIIGFENFPGIDLNKFEDIGIWNDLLFISINSSSNIWWEEITYSQNEKGRICYLDKPINNRKWAYRVTPRLNSFIRDVKKLVEELGGSLLLEEHNKKYVTREGIVLDGNIVFQEDLDEGRINLHEID